MRSLRIPDFKSGSIKKRQALAASAPKRAWVHTGMSTSPEYLVYQMAKQRCTNPKSPLEEKV